VPPPFSLSSQGAAAGGTVPLNRRSRGCQGLFRDSR